MAKRLFSAVLALMLIFSLLPAAVFAEGETYPYEAPKLHVVTAEETISGIDLYPGLAVILDVPEGPVYFNSTIADKATKEVYEKENESFANRDVQIIHIGYYADNVMESGTYTISVYFMDDENNQITPVVEADYEYTYPGKFDTPTNAKWTEDGDFDWTLPSGVTENDELFVRFGKVQENGEIKMIGMRLGPASGDTTRFLERFNERVNRNGEGDYCFSVRVISADITERFHSAWSDWSEPRHITSAGELKNSIENIATTDKDAAVTAVRGLNTNNLATSMAADNEGTGVVSALAELEGKLGLTATVENKADSGLDVDTSAIKVVGAGFNTTDNTKPTLTISKVDEELAIPNDGYVNNNLIQVDLSLGEKVATDMDGKLPVPIRITMPVPAGMNPEYLRILHYSENKTFDREIRPYTYQEDGVWMASFVVTHLSPFVFVEAAEGGSETPGAFTVTFDANGGTVSTSTAATGADGKLASLPTPTRSGYTFNGWFTAADGGESVTTATVFTDNTTVYAHWTAGSSGGGSSSGGSGSSGGSSGSTPAKPTTPTEPEKPTTPSVPVIDASEKFADVAKDAWYVQDVSYAVSHGLMNGTGSGSFEPNTPLSRAMLAQILYNYEDRPAVSAASGFTDVSGGWYADAVAWAAENGIVNGNSDGSFNPNGATTREQVAVILYRFAQSLGIDVSARGDLSAFADSASVSNYAAEAMAWATACGLINGSNGRLDPAGSATRAQAAAILHRFCENVIK